MKLSFLKSNTGIAIVGLVGVFIFGYFFLSGVFGAVFINLTLTTNPDLEQGLVGHWTFDGKDVTGTVGVEYQNIDVSSDDAEEDLTDGSIDIADPDLGLIVDLTDGDQEIGLRFVTINIPQGASIREAHINFAADGNRSDSTNLEFWAEAIDDAPTFTTGTNNITDRATTSASVAWNSVPAWTHTLHYDTPDLSTIIQEVIDRPGWVSGNDIVIIVTGDSGGERRTESLDGNDGWAPSITINYGITATDRSANGNDGVVNTGTTTPNPRETVDSSADSTNEEHNASSPTHVWINDTEGFIFYMDDGEDVQMASTSDAGVTWGNFQLVDSINTLDANKVAVWYDQWTPGDNSGTKIHISTFDDSPDEVYYTEYDTITNILSTTVVASSQGGTFANPNSSSITKAEDGEIYIIMADNNDSFIVSCSSTCTSAVNWSEITGSADCGNPPWSLKPDTSCGIDHTTLLPVKDTDNIMIIYWDDSSNDLLSNVYSATSSSFWGWDTIDSNALDNGSYYGNLMGATLDHTSGDIYLVYLGDEATPTANNDHDIDFTVWDRDTYTWNAQPQIETNLSTFTAAAVAIDENTGDLYVAYSRKNSSDDSGTANIFYTKSTDGGATWSATSTPLDTETHGIRGGTLNIMSDERISLTWSGESTDDIYHRTIVDLSPNLTPSAKPGRIGQALNFDGVDDYVDAGNVGSVSTVAFYIKRDTTGAEKLINIDGTDQIEINSSNTVVATSFLAATVYVDGSTADLVIDDNDWHHIIITDTSGVSASTFEIGRVGASYFDGKIDDVRTYNRVLSAGEILRLYQLGATTEISKTITTNPDLKSGLVGHWTFDGPDITVDQILDRSGNGNHGGFYNGATTSAATKGKFGQALHFDGVNDHVSIPHSASLNVSDVVTTSIWFRGDTLLDSFEAMVGKGANTVENRGFLLQIHSSTDDGRVRVDTDTPSQTPGGSTHLVDIIDGDWHHIVFVVDNGTFRSYKDGIEIVDTTYTHTGGFGSTQPVLIGSQENDDNFFNGDIDDVRIYNRALSAGEILRLYQLGATTEISKTITTNPDLESGLVGHWTFDGKDVTSTKGVEYQNVDSDTDDAEEYVSGAAIGTVDTTSSDLEMVNDTVDQEIGMRFITINIPQGATIHDTYITFTTDSTQSGTTNLVFWGEAIDDAPTFTPGGAGTNDITDRATTSASVAWSSVPTWTDDVVYESPDLSTIIQEIIDRSGWVSGNDIVIIVTGDAGQLRRAESFDGEGWGPAIAIRYGSTATDRSGQGNDGTIYTATTTSNPPETIDTSPDTSDEQHNSTSPNLVWINDQEGFIFYMDNGDDVQMASTTDGGETWGNFQRVDSVNTADAGKVAVWYDRWTPGDVTGTKIHIATYEHAVTDPDELYYTEYDTVTDVLSTTVSGYTASTATFGNDQNHLSITKAEDGTIYMTANDNAGEFGSYVLSCSSSCTSTVNWSDVTGGCWTGNPYYEGGGGDPGCDEDFPILLPVKDTNNIMLILWDKIGRELESNIYSATSSSWWGWDAVDLNATSNESGPLYYGNLMGATIDRKSGNIYLGYNGDEYDPTANNDHDLDFASWDRASYTWTVQSQILTDVSTFIGTKVAIDENTGDLYLTYGRREQSSGGATISFFYTKSTDGGATWVEESFPLVYRVNNLRGGAMNIMSDERIGFTYVDVNLPEVFHRTIVDLEPGVTTARGKLGQTLNFDGTDDYIDAVNVGSVSTVAFYIKRDTTGAEKLINIDGTDQIEINSSNTVVATSFLAATVYVDGSTADLVIDDNDWHHIIITDTSGVSASTFEIGRVGASYFDGKIDDVRTYNRVLSDDEIRRLYELGN